MEALRSPSLAPRSWPLNHCAAAKDGGRVFLKAGKSKIKKNKFFDECNGVSEFPFEFEKTPKSTKEKCKKDCRYEKKRRRNVKESKTEEVQRDVDEEGVEEISLVVEDCTRGIKKKFKKNCKLEKKVPQLVKESNIEEVQRVLDDEKVDEMYLVDKDCTRGMKKKFKKDCKQKKKPLQNVEVTDIEEVQRVSDEEKIDEISVVDEDCTKGMKKWLLQYKKSRPGLNVLQQRIDEFVTFHEEQREQERKEREARAAEGGWTVVVHHKGRKKTTEAETGTAVGSVASAAVLDKMSKKKAKEIPLDFYRFQKREAKRNEIMMLQSRFEQDKKRIQQLRAARKFKPY